MASLSSMLSEKGKPVLILENYKFREYRLMKGTGETCWTNKKCKARLFTLGPDKIFSRRTNEHDHEAEKEELLVRQKVNNAIKRKAQNDSFTEKPRKLIRKESSKDPNFLSILTDEDFRRFRKNLNRAKLQSHPKLPTSIEDVHIYLDQIEFKSVKEENMLMYNDSETHVVIISCASNLKCMCSLEIILVDGTFTYCTKFFLQMFTVMGYVNRKYIPLAFALLKDKKESSYSKVFQTLKVKSLEIGLMFSPKKVVSDFEIAILTASYGAFPSATFIGCRFHLSQSWWRKIAALGMTAEYKNKDFAIGKWLRYVFGLTFLPHADVAPVFVRLNVERPEDSRLREFSQYLSENYIADDATYPPVLWAALDDSVWRTNNGSEAFNSKFKSENSSPNPNINDFLQVMKEIQVDICAKIYSIKSNSIKNTPHKNQKFVFEKFLHYENGEIDQLDYVKCMSYKYNNKNCWNA